MQRFRPLLRRTTVTAVLLATAALPLLAQRAVKSGTWEAELRWRPRQGGTRVLWVDFQGRDGRGRDGGDFGMTMKVSDFTGLGADGNRWSGPVRFELSRDAGVIRFDGTFEDGLGEGTYRFEGNDRFIRELGLDGDADDDELLAMVIHDVRAEWARGLQRSGVRGLDADDLIAMHIHGVTTEFVTELSGMGYRDLAPDRLVALRIHGVTPEYIRGMRTSVGAADLDDLVAFRIHKVTPEFAREVDRLGFGEADPDDLVAMRIHGVTPAFIRTVQATGLRGIDLDELVAFRIHGIDAEWIREAMTRGARDGDDVVSYRIHGGRRRR